MIDLERIRADTPGVAHVAHLNNAGSSLPPRQVHDAVVGHLQRESEIGGYEAARERKDQWEHTYDALAHLLNAERDEIAVIENATRAWDMAFYAFRFAPGDRILTGRAEYASNWIALKQVTDRTGARIDVVPDDEHGQIDLAALESMLDDDVKLVSLVHVPTQSGLVNPAAEVGRLTRAAGVPLLLDACQSAGQLPLDVEELGCDILSGTGRKFLRGPRGTGFLYVRRGLIEQLEPPLLDMRAADWQPDGSYTIRSDARRFENWETYYAGKVGLGVAVDYALEIGIDAIRARIVELAGRLRAALREIDGVTLLDRGAVLAATVTFTIDGVSPADVQRRLDERAVNVSTMDATSAQLDYGPRGITEAVRSSVHYYNDDSDLDRLVEGVKEILWSKS
ncbi:MAG: aminotransferase class V-fold PLP-dependent enzyme [Gaiellaceae bacterium]